jgi:hypothetical protein
MDERMKESVGKERKASNVKERRRNQRDGTKNKGIC